MKTIANYRQQRQTIANFPTFDPTLPEDGALINDFQR
jgi:non-ribosomal peptide synthetase component F